MLWSNVIDALRGSLFVLAQVCGGSFGAAILIASALMRVALLPLTIPATRRRLLREQKLRALAPELAEIKRRYADKPDLLFAETRKLHDAHGVALFDRRAAFDSLVAFPPAAALYAAIRGAADHAGRFLWVADLAKPDRLLSAVAAVIAGAGAWVSSSNPGATSAPQLFPAIIATIVSFVVLSHFSAGLALYSVSNTIIGVAERAIAGRTIRSSVA
jgi:YidC/Oxa1 family membrane protein insertase